MELTPPSAAPTSSPSRSCSAAPRSEYVERCRLVENRIDALGNGAAGFATACAACGTDESRNVTLPVATKRDARGVMRAAPPSRRASIHEQDARPLAEAGRSSATGGSVTGEASPGDRSSARPSPPASARMPAQLPPVEGPAPCAVTAARTIPSRSRNGWIIATPSLATMGRLPCRLGTRGDPGDRWARRTPHARDARPGGPPRRPPLWTFRLAATPSLKAF